MAASPNYQGMFLRGHGSQSHVKNNGLAIGNTAAAHSSGDLGIIQGDATRNVEAANDNLYRWVTKYVHVWNGPFLFGSVLDHPGKDSGTDRLEWKGMNMYNGFSFNLARSVPTADEIRPANIAVRLLVRRR